MLKIHIMGGPGSGKTTLGKEIASRFALPCYDLDTIGMSNEVEQTDAAYIQNASLLPRSLAGSRRVSISSRPIPFSITPILSSYLRFPGERLPIVLCAATSPGICVAPTRIQGSEDLFDF